jgi:phage portal protein BeeE
MPSFLDNIKANLHDGLKTASGLFSNGGGTSTNGNAGYNWGGRSLFGASAGTAIRWDQVTGQITDNPIAFTCLSIICDNFVQARIVVEKKQAGEDKYEREPSHPVNTLFAHPNPFYSWDYLTKGVISSQWGTGDAYIGVERDGSGKPVELYWLPAGVTPRYQTGTLKLIGWNYQQGKQITPVDLPDILHIPMGVNPQRPGFGMSGWQTLKQSQYILQQGDNYTANVMRNNGTVGGLITPKVLKDTDGSIIQPTLDGKSVVDMWRAKTQGDRVGEMAYLDFPMDVTFPNNTPENLSISTILDRPENNICAVFRVSIMLVGAYGGRESKTYANLQEARQGLWEERLLPDQATIASQLTTQLLSQFSDNSGGAYRIAYDTSGIRALQPDADALHKRYREDFRADLITRADFKRGTKQQVNPEDENVYRWMLPTVTDTATTNGGQVQQGLANAGHDVSLLADKQDVAEQQRNAPPMPPGTPQNGVQSAGRELVGVGAASNGNGRNGAKSSRGLELQAYREDVLLRRLDFENEA